MKGLHSIPTTRQLQYAYQKLQFENEMVSLKEWALWSQWARLDPRLAEIYVLAMFQTWQQIAPTLLHSELQKQPWPSAMGVLLEHVAMGYGWIDPIKKQFHAWKLIVMFQIPKTNHALFFLGIFMPASTSLMQEVLFSTKGFAKWGYFGKTPLWNKQTIGNKTISTKRARLKILEDLTRSKRKFSVADYRLSLQNAISIRQAQRDLADYSNLKKIGNTQGRLYQKK